MLIRILSDADHIMQMGIWGQMFLDLLEMESNH